MLKRFGRAGAGLVAAVCLAACSGGADQDEGKPTPSAASDSGGIPIEAPKDAAANDVCDLLPADAATSLGFDPEGRSIANMIEPDAPDGCEWKTPENRGAGVTLTSRGDRSIGEYHQNREVYSDFEELTIAGHPAVRANQGDPMQDGSCNVFLGTKDDQVLASQASANAGEAGTTDPCDTALKALEASVPTLPQAAG